MYFDLPLFY